MLFQRLATEVQLRRYQWALDRYLNNVGIRKIARLIGTSPALIVRWIKAFGARVSHQLQQAAQSVADTVPDVIEINAIDTFVKQQRAIIWVVSRRRQGRIVVYVIGEGASAASALYRKVKAFVPAIARIGTDANSCDAVAFAQDGVPEPHVVNNAQTHVIESASSCIRDNLVRFTRRSKRYARSWHMLDVTLRLFLQYQYSNT